MGEEQPSNEHTLLSVSLTFSPSNEHTLLSVSLIFSPYAFRGKSKVARARQRRLKKQRQRQEGESSSFSLIFPLFLLLFFFYSNRRGHCQREAAGGDHTCPLFFSFTRLIVSLFLLVMLGYARVSWTCLLSSFPDHVR